MANHWALAAVVSEEFLNRLASTGIGDGIEAAEFRQQFNLPMLGSLDLGVTMVYGHTPNEDFGVRWNTPFSIGVDTGAVYGGPLTAIRLPDEKVFQA